MNTIKHLNKERCAIITPSLEEITKNYKPSEFVIELVERNESIGKYIFPEPTTYKTNISYLVTVLISRRPHSKVPADLINTATEVLTKIANETRKKNKATKIIHTEHFGNLQDNHEKKYDGILQKYVEKGYVKVAENKYEKTY